MKYVLVTLLLLTTFISCEEIESYTFASLSWGSAKEEVKKCLNEKGYTLDQELSDIIQIDNSICFDGKVVGEEAHILVIFNSNNKLVKCFVVLYPGNNEEIETYESVRDILTSKYGNPKNKFKSFEYPYEEGDGYEEQAIELGKAHYITIWSTAKDNSMLGIEISKDLNIQISYEGSGWETESEKIKTKQAEDL